MIKYTSYNGFVYYWIKIFIFEWLFQRNPVYVVHKMKLIFEYLFMVQSSQMS